MTATVFMVRHGAHDRLGRILCGRMAGVSLSEQGKAEAEALARRLGGRRIAAVYASPMERARQTAAPIAEAAGLPLMIDEDLNEIDFGDWSGQPFDALPQQPGWSRWNDDRTAARPPGGESMGETQARVARFLARAAQVHAGQEVVAVSHADVIKAALMHVMGLPLSAYDRFDIDPASISVIVAGDWGHKVNRMNEAAA